MAHEHRSRRRFHWPRLSWANFLRGFGAVSAGWEIFYAHSTNSEIYVLIMAMLGFADFIDKRTRNEDEDDRPSRVRRRKNPSD